MPEFNRKEMHKAIEAALKSNVARAWVEGEGFTIYIRNTRRRLICDLNQGVPIRAITDSFDLSNIVIRKPGKGHFTSLLDYLEPICRKTIYVEHVHSERLQNFLLRRGYSRNHNPGFPEICFFKMPA